MDHHQVALQEGWDCPFAYILVSLNNTASQQSMTQLVGRVLRQPYVTKTAFEELNESYVFCLRKRAGNHEGSEKSAGKGRVRRRGRQRRGSQRRHTEGRQTNGQPYPARVYAALPHSRLKGRFICPHFCVKNGRKDPEKLDYFRHLHQPGGCGRFRLCAIDWDLTTVLAAARTSSTGFRSNRTTSRRVGEQASVSLENDEQVKGVACGQSPFDYFSHKQSDSSTGRD